MADLLPFLWLLSCVIAPALGSTCYDYFTSSSGDYSIYCPDGCCGSYGQEYCCLADAAVAGIIIGSLFAIIAVAVIILLCIRYHMRKTVLIRPSVAVVSHGTSASTYPTSAAYRPQNYHTGVYPPQTNAPGVYPPQTNAPGVYPPQTNAPGVYPPQTNAPGVYPPQPYPPQVYPPQPYPPQVYPPPAYSNPAFPPPPYPNAPEPANAPANMATAQPQK